MQNPDIMGAAIREMRRLEPELPGGAKMIFCRQGCRDEETNNECLKTG